MENKKPRPPKAGEHVFHYFLWLNSARSSNMNGPNPLDFVQLDAFQRVTGIKLRDWEIRALFRMDRTLLEYTNKTEEERQAAPQPVSKRPMSPALFDALFD